MEIAKQGTVYACTGLIIGLVLALGDVPVAILASISMFQVLLIPYSVLAVMQWQVGLVEAGAMIIVITYSLSYIAQMASYYAWS